MNLLSTARVAEMLGISESTLRYWRWRGEGPKSFRLGKLVRYREDDVLEWVQAQEVATSAGGVL